MHRRFKTASIIRGFSGFAGGEGAYPPRIAGGYCNYRHNLHMSWLFYNTMFEEVYAQSMFWRLSFCTAIRAFLTLIRCVDTIYFCLTTMRYVAGRRYSKMSFLCYCL